MPFSPITLDGRPLADGGCSRSCFPQSGSRGIRRRSVLKREVRRGLRGSVELLSGSCLILLPLLDLEYVSSEELSTQPV